MAPDDVHAFIRAHGAAARAMLALPGYTLVLSNMADYHQAAMSATPLGAPGREAREAHHAMLNAIRDFHTEVASYAGALDALEADEAAARDDSEQETE